MRIRCDLFEPRRRMHGLEITTPVSNALREHELDKRSFEDSLMGKALKCLWIKALNHRLGVFAKSADLAKTPRR